MQNEAIIKVLLNVREAVRDIDRFKERVDNNLKQIKGGFIASAVGAFSFVSAFKEIKRLSDFTTLWKNTDIESLSQLNNLMKGLGLNTEEVTSAIGNLNQSLVEARISGSGSLVDIGKIANINLAGVRNGIDLLEQLRASYQRLNESGKAKLLQTFGIFNPKLVRYMSLSNEEFAKLRKTTDGFRVISQKDADAIVKFEQALNKLKSTFTSIGVSIISWATPIVNFIDDVINKIIALPDIVKNTVFGFLVGAGAIKGALLGLATASGVLQSGLSAVLFALKAIAKHPVIAVEVFLFSNWDTAYDWANKFVKWFDNLVADILDSSFALVNKFFSWFGEKFSSIKNILGFGSNNSSLAQGGAGQFGVIPSPNSFINNNSSTNSITNNNSSPRITQNITFNVGNADEALRLERGIMNTNINQYASGVVW